jgi:hypothetical protein
MSSESRIWENRPFGSMKGGKVLVIGGNASQPSLSCLLYQVTPRMSLLHPQRYDCRPGLPTRGPRSSRYAGSAKTKTYRYDYLVNLFLPCLHSCRIGFIQFALWKIIPPCLYICFHL